MIISLISENDVSKIEEWSTVCTVPEKWMSPPIISREMAIRFVNNQDAGNATTQIYLIIPDGSVPIGFLTTRSVSGNCRDGPPICEVGILIDDSKFRNCGYGVKAMQKLFDVIFTETVCHRIQAMVDLDNLPAIKLFSRLGMKKDGVLRQYTWRGGEFRDETVFSYLRGEWEIRNNLLKMEEKND